MSLAAHPPLAGEPFRIQCSRTVIANRVLVIETRVNRNPFPLAPLSSGCFSTCRGESVTGQGIPLGTNCIPDISRQTKTHLGAVHNEPHRFDSAQPPFSRESGFGGDSLDATACFGPRASESAHRGIFRGVFEVGGNVAEDRTSGHRDISALGMHKQSVRLSPRKAAHEKRDVDQCDPAGGMPDCDRGRRSSGGALCRTL